MLSLSMMLKRTDRDGEIDIINIRDNIEIDRETQRVRDRNRDVLYMH